MKKKLLITSSLIALTGAIVFGSGYAIAPVASQLIRQNGFPDAKISSISLTPTGVMIDHIALDANDFSTVDNINIGINWIDFIKTRRIQSITIKDISLTCEFDDAHQFKIAGWDAKYPESHADTSLMPIQSLLLEGVTLDIATPDGDIRVQGKLTVDTPTATEQTIQYAIWGQQQQASFDAKGSGKLDANGNISLSTTLNDGRLNLPQLEISRASGWVDFHKEKNKPTPSYSGQLVAGKINTLGTLLQNVTITLDTTKPEALFFKTSPAGHNDISLTGRWLSQETNQLELIVTSASSLELVELLAPQKVDDLKPWLQTANPLSLNITAPASIISNTDKTANFELNVGNKNTNIILKSTGQAHYTPSSPDINIHIEKTLMNVAGGQVELAPFSVSSGFQGTPPLDLSMSLQDINMAELAKLADVEGLKAKGTLNGTIPLTVSDKGIVFDAGAVQSKGEGTFSYTPTSFPPSLQGDDERMQTVRQALSDFHFTNFSVDLSGAVNGKMKTTFKAEGNSPVFGDRPIHLNLNLDGDLGSVIQQTLQAGDISDKIRSELTGAKK